jgi:signal transduction histidine kinase
VKIVLLIGFGGILGLMAVAGLDSVRALHRIQSQNIEITQNYLTHHHFLEQIRSDLYLSSTYVRDALLAPTREAVKTELSELRQLHGEMDSAVRAYSNTIRPEEKELFSELRKELSQYWGTLAPVMHWHEEPRTAGFRFLQGQVLPRRAVVLGIADKIGAVNEQALRNGDRMSAMLFDSYRRRVIAILGLTLGIGLVLAAGTIRHTLRLERESRLRYEEMKSARSEMKMLSARLLKAQEEERRAISRELHDQVGQSLNALLVDLGNLAAVTPQGDEEAGRLLSTAKKLAEESVRALRNMSLLLRPSMLDDFGLVPALHWQAREVSRRTGMRVDVEAEEEAEELPDEHKTCVYRVVQEALHNCSRHAEARNVRIAVRQEPERLVLTIRDDGRGFDTARVRGLGLLGMEERVKNLGGTFVVLSGAGLGTKLIVELPLPATRVQTSAVGA